MGERGLVNMGKRDRAQPTFSSSNRPRSRPNSRMKNERVVATRSSILSGVPRAKTQQRVASRPHNEFIRAVTKRRFACRASGNEIVQFSCLSSGVRHVFN